MDGFHILVGGLNSGINLLQGPLPEKKTGSDDDSERNHQPQPQSLPCWFVLSRRNWRLPDVLIVFRCFPIEHDARAV